MIKYPRTPFGQLFATGVKGVLWNEGYEYEQIMAALAWLAWKLTPADKSTVLVTRRGFYSDVNPNNKALAKEIDALLNQVIKYGTERWNTSLCFRLFLDQGERAQQVAGPLGKPSLRLYNQGEHLFAHSLLSMSWVEERYKYQDLLPLCGQVVDEYRRLDYQDGWIRLWHKHVIGDVLVLEVGEGDLYRLWDVNSTASRLQHRRFWPICNRNLSYYVNEHLVCYENSSYFSFYGPACDGIILNSQATAVADVPSVGNFLGELLYESVLSETKKLFLDHPEKVELKFNVFHRDIRTTFDWYCFRINNQRVSNDSLTQLNQKLEQWLRSLTASFPNPATSLRFALTVDLRIENNHDLLGLLDNSLV